MKQVLREQKRNVDRATRSLDRERAQLERQEKTMIMDIKKNAKAGQMKSVKSMAKDLVRIRKHQEKFVNLTAQLRAIGLQMTAMASTQQLTESVKGVTKSMVKLNKSIKLPELQKIMMEFAKQTEQMDMKQEMIGDSLEDAMDDVDDEEETDRVVGSIMAEIGLSMDDSMVSAPQTKTQVQAEPEKVNEADKELEARLNNLK